MERLSYTSLAVFIEPGSNSHFYFLTFFVFKGEEKYIRYFWQSSPGNHYLKKNNNNKIPFKKLKKKKVSDFPF